MLLPIEMLEHTKELGDLAPPIPVSLSWRIYIGRGSLARPPQKTLPPYSVNDGVVTSMRQIL